ncbi:amidase [Salinifilum aidingensis]
MDVDPGSGIPSSLVPEPVLLDAVELSWSIRRRDISCAEVMRAHLEQIDALNPHLGAIVSRADTESLLHEARRCDEELARGEHRGWLHGLPMAIKDLSHAEGFPTTGGFPAFLGETAKADDPFVRRIRAAGGIIIGKTNVPEAGLGSHTFNSAFGTTTNPYDRTRAAGGSSGGAAAALAARMLPVADGSDFMGSLRNPAAYCNVVSLRPGFGRVPAPGFVSNPAVTGPMGRTVRDIAMLLSTMAGPDRGAPMSLRDDPAAFAAPLHSEPGGTRIGWIGDFGGKIPTEPGVLEVCRDSFATFHEIGCTVEPVTDPPPPEQAWETFLLWRHWMLGMQWAGVDTTALEATKPELRYELAGYERLSTADVARALQGRSDWHAAVDALFDHYDFLLAPSAQVFPFDAAQRYPEEIAGVPMDTYHRWMEIVAPWTLSGHPVLNLPAGFRNGLPMGVQVIGPDHDEWSLLRLGHAYEQASDWVHRALPPVLR